MRRNINLYRGGSGARIGQQALDQLRVAPTIPFALQTPKSAIASGIADMVRALTAKAEKDKEDKIRTDMLAAMVGPGYEYDPSKASESFTPSPLMKSHRVALANAQAQAQPEGVSALGLQPSDTPYASGPYVQGGELEPVTQMSGGPLTGVLNDFEREAEREAASTQFEMDRGIRALGSEALAPPQFESTEFTPELTPQPNLGDDAAMRAALIGDVATPEEELAAYAGSPEERAAQERAYTATVNTPDAVAARMAEAVRLNPDIAKDPAYAQFVQSNLARKQAELDAAIERERAKAIRGEEFVQALAVAEAGRAPVGITAKVAPNLNYPSGYGYVDLRTGTDLGEAPAPKASTEITIGSGDLKKGFRTTEAGAEYIPGGSEDPKVIAEKEKVTKEAGLGVKNLEKLPGKRGAIYADHIKTPTLRTSINRAIELAKSPFSSGMAQWMLDKVPLPEVKGVNLGAAFDLKVALDSVKANVGFNELLRIKEAGGTLGALSEMENRLLQAMQGALVAEQDKEALIPALEQVMEIWELNLQQKKNEFKTIYSKDGGWETDERRPWEPPPDSGISQQEWDEMSAEEKASMEAGA